MSGNPEQPTEHRLKDPRPRFGRRRALALLSASLFGAASRAFAPKKAGAAPTPTYCFGAPGCDTCSGTVCTECYNGRSYNCKAKYSGITCWSAKGGYAGGGCYHYYTCCDWYRSDWSVCICRGYLGILCPSAPQAVAAAN